MTDFTGSVGNDTIAGTNGDDTFDLTQGGNDNATGLDATDSFSLGATLTYQDRINGGDGTDTLILDGDYSTGVTLKAATLVNVEVITLTAGHSYKITTNDANFVSSQGYIDIRGYTLGATDTLYFNGSNETSNSYNLHGGAGNDVLYGGDIADTFDLFAGGDDTCFGGAGGDFFTFEGPSFTGADRLDGGADNDHLNLNGDYSSGVHFGKKSMTNIENLNLFHSHSYTLKLADGNVAAGQTLHVDGGIDVGQKLVFNGSKELDGKYVIEAGADSDQLIGGAGDDVITGGGKGDDLTGGAGNDTFVYLATTDSRNTKVDHITDLTNSDIIDLFAIDADTGTAGNQAFTLVGAFSGAAGQLTLTYDAGSDTTSILMDVNGDSLADAKIVANGNHLAFNDFVL